MWLIDTSTLTLCYFNDSKAQKYGILSHVWQADNEMNFQEFRNGEGKHKPGYSKIVGTCEMLRTHGYQYAWVDTVFINKESSAELSEAINSMWKWYCDAGICYAYLEDIPDAIQVVDQDDDDLAHEWSSIHDCKDFELFSQSAWFSRGWTLQELVAPGEVIFYNVDWQLICKKSKTLETLAMMTGIDVLALEDRVHLDQFVAARKLSWAARRRTTRTEDRAYSMLGIMGYHLPLLYGEGSRAFVRLQEEIVKYTDDQSIFAWEWGGSAQSNVANLLFADSPVQFESCSKMVAWDNRYNEEFRITNRGLTFDGILFDEQRELAILKCRHEDNLLGPVALRVVLATRASTPTSSAQCEYLVGAQGPRTALWNCTEVTDGSAGPAVRQVTLLRTHESLRTRTPFSPPLKLQICQHHDSAERADICQAWPQSLWNNHTGVFSRPIRRRESDKLAFTTFLELRSSETSVSFWLGIQGRQSYYALLDCSEGITVEVVLSYVSLEHARAVMTLVGLGQVALLEGSSGIPFTYQLPVMVAPQPESVNILGDNVLKFDILIGRQATWQDDEKAESSTVITRNEARGRGALNWFDAATYIVRGQNSSIADKCVDP